MKFDSETPIEYRGSDKGPDWAFVAVPRNAREKYNTPHEFEEAITSFQVEGMMRSKELLSARFLVRRDDQRFILFREHKVERTDAMEGIVVVTKDVSAKPPAKPKKDPTPKGTTEPKKNAEVKEADHEITADPSLATPRDSAWIAGLAASVGLLLVGVWLFRRTRR